jgi:uncharacterized protein (TIGR02001 family)
MRARFAYGLIAAFALAGPAAAQQHIGALDLTAASTPTIATDYLFRGISQTRNRPVAQLTLDVAHDSGLYVGGFLSNVAFAGTDARQEVDLLADYRFEGPGTSRAARVPGTGRARFASGRRG